MGQIPSHSHPIADRAGRITTPWYQFLMRLLAASGGGGAPTDAGYILDGADGDLPDARVATSSATVTVDVSVPGVISWDAAAGSGDVVGPGSATDNAIARYDLTTGKLIQNSGITIADGATGTLSGSNSGDVTLAGTPDYITIAGQVITRNAVDLAADVTGDLPYANITPATGASKILVRGSGAGGGDWQEGTLGTGLAFTGTVLAATSAAGGAASIGCTFDGGGVALTAGGIRYVLVPYAHTITSNYMLADQSGSAVVDVWRDSYANYPPTVADTITASAKPTITATNKSTDSTLTGWSTTGSANAIYAFKLDSVSTITFLQVQLVVART